MTQEPTSPVYYSNGFYKINLALLEEGKPHYFKGNHWVKKNGDILIIHEEPLVPPWHHSKREVSYKVSMQGR